MANSENYTHTNNRKKKIKENCQIGKFALFKRIMLKVTLAPKNSTSEREINLIFRTRLFKNNKQ